MAEYHFDQNKLVTRETPQGEIVHPIDFSGSMLAIPTHREMARRRLNQKLVREHLEEELPIPTEDTGYKTNGKYG